MKQVKTGFQKLGVEQKHYPNDHDYHHYLDIGKINIDEGIATECSVKIGEW